MNFQRILFPADLSDRCFAAARYVRAMATSFNSNVAVVHAVDDGSAEPDPAVPPSDLEQSLQSFAASELPDIDVAILSEPGDPAKLIERVSQEWQADLIMMPTRGRGPFESAILGSLTTKVLHDLSIPVWTEVHQEAVLSEKHLPIRKIVCAIDLEPASVRVLRFATEFASACGATMSIAHGIPVTEMLLGKYIEVEPPETMEDFARREIAELQKEASTSCEVWLQGAPIADVVRNAAARHGADLLVIGRGEIRHRSNVLWEHTHSIIRESLCPVLSI